MPGATTWEAPADAAPGASGCFHARLVPALPRPRAHALNLVRHAVAIAPRGQARFEPGTDLVAWSRSIVRDRSVGSARGRRRRRELDGGPDGTGPAHDDRPAMKQLAWMQGCFPAAVREALLPVAVRGRAVGTAGSRVSRARQHLLRAWPLGGWAAIVQSKAADACASASQRVAAT